MRELLQITIEGFPLDSFLAMLAAFWLLGFLLTRGGSRRSERHRAPRPAVPFQAPKAGQQSAGPNDWKQAA